MVRFAGGKKEVQKPEWKDGWASARFREFGNFQLVEDREAPLILPLHGFRDGALLHKAAGISFRVKDGLGAICHFRAELDPGTMGPPGERGSPALGPVPPHNGKSGQWLCFTNDKELAFIYKFDEHCPRGKRLLRVSVEDVAGNRTVKEYRFRR
jgi:hypothetical protein